MRDVAVLRDAAAAADDGPLCGGVGAQIQVDGHCFGIVSLWEQTSRDPDFRFAKFTELDEHHIFDTSDIVGVCTFQRYSVTLVVVILK